VSPDRYARGEIVECICQECRRDWRQRVPRPRLSWGSANRYDRIGKQMSLSLACPSQKRSFLKHAWKSVAGPKCTKVYTLQIGYERFVRMIAQPKDILTFDISIWNEDEMRFSCSRCSFTILDIILDIYVLI